MLNCNICNKIYASKNSLYNHNKKFHTNIENEIIIKNYLCKICNKIFTSRQGKYQHEKICKNKKETIHDLEIKKIELEKIKEENKLIQLKIKLQSINKIDTKTFKALNKILMNRSYINNTVNNTINNTINNINLISFGKEEIVELLTNQDKKMIMNSKYCCLEKMIELTNCGSYNQFKNIIITNIKDNFLYKYDDKLKYFVIANKLDTINELVNNRVMDIEVIYDELSTANKIDQQTKDIICSFLNKIQDDNIKFIDENENINYTNYKDYKINKIKILLYNNQDKITKDLALYFN